MFKVEDFQEFYAQGALRRRSELAFIAIASAYGDYTKKSFEDTKSFVEKLSGVKSIDKAFRKFRANTPNPPMRPSLPNRRRSRVSIPIWPSRPTSRWKAW